jgi:hypothetical protein
MLIDLFGEDNMSDLEVSLNFIQRMSSFSDAFYANVSLFFHLKLFVCLDYSSYSLINLQGQTIGQEAKIEQISWGCNYDCSR